MEMIKSIDASVTYAAFDNYWWMNNDTPPNIWGKQGLVIPKRKWNKFFTDNFEPFQVDYQTKDKKNQFVPKYTKAVRKIVGGTSKKFLVQVKHGVETKKDITVDIEIYFDMAETENVKKIVNDILKMVIFRAEKTQVYMVIQDSDGLDLRSFEINIPELDIELNYGKEWADKHDYLLGALSRDVKKGIALLHGLPGTGKSMYIRHLISIMAETRTMIYLPNQLIGCLTEPSFLPLMADYPNAILIIEDAEEAIKSRKQGGQTVDKLLNLSDGIISDFLGTQIICTFNNDISTIDEALLRKGRLILKHEFKKLNAEQAQKLSKNLGFDTEIKESMTLSEVYNQEEKHSEDMKERTAIGFGSR